MHSSSMSQCSLHAMVLRRRMAETIGASDGRRQVRLPPSPHLHLFFRIGRRPARRAAAAAPLPCMRSAFNDEADALPSAAPLCSSGATPAELLLDERAAAKISAFDLRPQVQLPSSQHPHLPFRIGRPASGGTSACQRRPGRTTAQFPVERVQMGYITPGPLPGQSAIPWCAGLRAFRQEASPLASRSSSRFPPATLTAGRCEVISTGTLIFLVRATERKG